jgi:DNA modification methylase
MIASQTTDLFVEHTELKSGIDQWQGKSRQGAVWTVYKGHARPVLERIADESVNCVVTSPPYYWLRDYGSDQQIGLEETVSGYVDSICKVMNEVRRVLKPDGLLFLNIGDTYYSGKGESQGQDRKSRSRRFGLRAVDKSGGLGIGLRQKTIIGVPWRVAIAMSQQSWILRSPIIWHREDCLPEQAKDRPSRSYEHVFMFAKNRKYYFNREALINQEIEEDMWSIAARPQSTKGIRTAPFPDELVRRCLSIGCPAGGFVLDPFAGSGTTLRVAIKSGRPAMGIDVNEKFCDYMVSHLSKL